MHFVLILDPFFGSGLGDRTKTFASGSGFSLVRPVGGFRVGLGGRWKSVLGGFWLPHEVDSGVIWGAL